MSTIVKLYVALSGWKSDCQVLFYFILFFRLIFCSMELDAPPAQGDKIDFFLVAEKVYVFLPIFSYSLAFISHVLI